MQTKDTSKSGMVKANGSQPLLHQHGIEIQKFGTLRHLPIALDVAAKSESGTNDLLMSDLLRTNELQTWFIAEHLVDTPVVHI